MIALIIMAGLATLPTDPYEAADVDGATAWRKFVSITLPLLKPTIIVAAMLRLIDVLKTFDIIYATTQGGPNFASETLNLYGYVLGFQYFKLGTDFVVTCNLLCSGDGTDFIHDMDAQTIGGNLIMKPKKGLRFIQMLLTFLVLIAFGFPFVWMLLASFKDTITDFIDR